MKGIILDLGGTVLSPSAAPFLDAEWEQRLGLDDGVLSACIWGSPMAKQATVGAVDFLDFWLWAGRTLGLPETAMARLHDAIWAGYTLDADIASWLQELRPRVRVVTLSNAWSDARAQVTSRFAIDVRAEDMLFSAEQKVAKPDTRAFQLAAAHLGLTPSAIVFADDEQTNVAAADSLGFQTVHVASPAQLIRDVNKLLA